MKEEKLNIKGGYLQSNGNFRLLLGTDKLLSVADVKIINNEVNPIAVVVVPDWILQIFPWDLSDSKFFGAWIYKQGKYHLVKLDFHKMTTDFKSWLAQKESPPTFMNSLFYQHYEPPFVEIYNEQKEKLLGNDLKNYESTLPAEYTSSKNREIKLQSQVSNSESIEKSDQGAI